MTTCPRCDMRSDLCICKDETDQTPEARLAAALEQSGYAGTFRPGIIVARAILAADPTLAADLALAAAVRRLESQSQEYTIEAGPQWYAVQIGVQPKVRRPILTAAIAAAKEAERE